MEYMIINGELYHYGIKGQKWGVRRWQNSDGTFNAAGKKRYFDTSSAKSITKSLNKIERQNAKLTNKSAIAKIKAEKAYQKGNDKKYQKYTQRAKDMDEAIKAGNDASKKIIENAVKNGYQINSRSVTRYTGVGKQVAATVLLPGIGNTTLLALDAYRGGTYGKEAAGLVKGTKYTATRLH